MKQIKMKLSVLLFIASGLTGVHAQQAITASGGEASGSEGTVSYSVGQVVYTTNIGANGSVAQGVEHPYEISVVTGLKEASGINLICSAYPNSTKGFLILKIEGNLQPQYLASLYDLSGKLLKSIEVEANETSFDLSNLVIARYLLKVIQGNREVKIFKIIKN